MPEFIGKLFASDFMGTAIVIVEDQQLSGCMLSPLS
jgi:hypothetical protein